jgi:hypothetical protein
MVAVLSSIPDRPMHYTICRDPLIPYIITSRERSVSRLYSGERPTNETFADPGSVLLVDDWPSYVLTVDCDSSVQDAVIRGLSS